MSSRLVLVLSASFLAACGTPSVSDDAGVATGGGTASTGGGAAAGGGTATGGGVATGGGFATGGGAASGGGTALDAGVPGRELFVATTGNDSNPGTSALPFRTINKGITSAGTTEDTTVTVRAGIYVEKVVITGTGATTVAHLTLRSAPGELAIIDGTGLTPSGQQGLIDLANRSHVTIDGFEVRNFRTSNTNVPVGIQLTGTEDDVTLINNHVHDIITTNESCSGSGGNALGIAVYGDRAPQAITNLTIRNNELNAMKTGCSETMTLNGNVDGFVIEGNRVHDNDNIGIDIIGFEGTSPMAAFDQARNGVIRNNQVWDITSLNNPAYAGEQAADGIYVDGGKNVLIEGNVVHHADLGIELASEHAGKASSYVLARSNVVYQCPQAGLSIGGYSGAVGNTDHTVLLNNTLYENAVELQIQFHVTTTVFQNTLSFNSTSAFVSGSTAGVTLVSNAQRTGNVASTFVNPPMDLRPASGAMAAVVNQGTAFSACPAGWTCPAVWGSVLQGATDVAGNARVNGVVDLGAFEN